MVVPIKDGVTVALLLGVFGCLRSIIPHINIQENGQEMQGSFGLRKDEHHTNQQSTDRFVQIYELCLYYLTHSDHNVINAALETLHILLENPSEHLLSTLLSPSGITRSRITPIADGTSILKMRSMSKYNKNSYCTLYAFITQSF